jgi:hypothetical protein
VKTDPKYRLPSNLPAAGATLAFLVGLGASMPAHAVGTRHWVLERADDFKGGDLKGVAIDSSGKVRAGFDLGRVPVENTSVIWSALARKDGSILLGTGSDGLLLELRDGKTTKLAESKALVVTSLVEGWDNAVYASTLPQGKVFKWAHNKLVEFVTLPGVEHVWQLVFDAKRGVLYAATGPQGKLFRISKDGHADVEFDAPEEHLMSLALMPDGSVVTGTSDKAKLYRVTGPSRSTVLYDFGRTEVRAIAVSPRGDVYAIANDIKTSTATTSRAKNSDNPAGPSTQGSKIRGKGILVRIDPVGVPEVLLNEDDEQLICLALGRDGQPYVGTGAEGRIYTVTESHRSVLVADTEERQVSALQLLGATPFVVSSDPAVVHMIRGMGGVDAAWTSKALDAGLRASFGKLDWQSTGDVQMLTRSGNTKEPDDSWSAWSAPLVRPGRIASPPGRYFQVKARFGNKGLPDLGRVEVFFITDNQRAVITRVDATPGGSSDRSLSEGVAASGGPISGRASSEVNLEWQVDNPDRDTLRYRVKYQPLGTADWFDLLQPNEVLSKTSYKWDTSAVPEGRYRVFVEASDELANPPQRTTRHSLESGVIVVDSTPPAIQDLSLVGRRVKLRAVDGVSPIQRVEIAVVGADAWFPLDSADGVFDEPNESVDVDVSGIIPPGKHLVAVRAYDAAGNFTVRSVAAE